MDRYILAAIYFFSLIGVFGVIELMSDSQLNAVTTAGESAAKDYFEKKKKLGRNVTNTERKEYCKVAVNNIMEISKTVSENLLITFLSQKKETHTLELRMKWCRDLENDPDKCEAFLAKFLTDGSDSSARQSFKLQVGSWASAKGSELFGAALIIAIALFCMQTGVFDSMQEWYNRR